MTARALPVLLPPPGAVAIFAFKPGESFGGESRIAARVWIALVAVFLLASGAAEAATAPNQPGAFAILWKWTPFLAQGFLWNIIISVLAMMVGSVMGLFLGMAQVSPSRILRAPSKVVTQLLRNAPWLVLLFYCMFLLPFQIRVFGSTFPLPDWLKASFGFALPVMAYVAEIVRGAVQSIPASQWESAEALAFSRRQVLWMIIIPQCIKRMLPPWMNLYAIVTMATVLANVVGVSEMLTAAREALAAEQRADLLLPMYGYILLWFFAYCYPIARFTLALERRWGVRE
jgi:polar amino acid transport system permease protein